MSSRTFSAATPHETRDNDLYDGNGTVFTVTNRAASFRRRSQDRKLSPVTKTKGKDGQIRLKEQPPYVCSTYVSIEATCSDACAFRKTGCYVVAGATAGPARALDQAASGHSAAEVIAEEVMLIDRSFARGVPQDGARGGRDLRLHVGGDVGSVLGAVMLGQAATRWGDRGGGAVWSYTHWWREIPRAAWGEDVSILASVEKPEDIEEARRAGYPAAIVVDSFPSKRAFHLPGTTAKLVPCPAQTVKTTCVECRLCLGVDLLKLDVAIAFEAHGPQAKKIRDNLVQLRVGKDRPVPQKAL